MSWFRVKLALGFQLGAANRLLSAAEEGRALDVAQILSARPHLAPYTGFRVSNTALHRAAAAGDLEVCRAIIDIIEQKASIAEAATSSAASFDDNKNLANHNSSSSSSSSSPISSPSSAIKWRRLLHSIVNQRNSRGMTPLMLACEYGHANIVSYLLRHGANPLLTDLNNSRTALHHAAVGGHVDCLKILCSDSTKYTTKLSLIRNNKSSRKSRKNSPGGGDGDGDGDGGEEVSRTLRDIVVPDSQVQSAKYIDHRAFGGLTALHFATVTGNLEAVQVLLNAGAATMVKTDGDAYIGSEYLLPGSSPLHIAVIVGNVSVIHGLLQSHAELMMFAGAGERVDERGRRTWEGHSRSDLRSVRNSNRRLPFHLARERGLTQVVALVDPRIPIDSALDVARDTEFGFGVKRLTTICLMTLQKSLLEWLDDCSKVKAEEEKWKKQNEKVVPVMTVRRKKSQGEGRSGAPPLPPLSSPTRTNGAAGIYVVGSPGGKRLSLSLPPPRATTATTTPACTPPAVPFLPPGAVPATEETISALHNGSVAVASSPFAQFAGIAATNATTEDAAINQQRQNSGSNIRPLITQCVPVTPIRPLPGGPAASTPPPPPPPTAAAAAAAALEHSAYSEVGSLSAPTPPLLGIAASDIILENNSNISTTAGIVEQQGRQGSLHRLELARMRSLHDYVGMLSVRRAPMHRRMKSAAEVMHRTDSNNNDRVGRSFDLNFSSAFDDDDNNNNNGHENDIWIDGQGVILHTEVSPLKVTVVPPKNNNHHHHRRSTSHGGGINNQVAMNMRRTLSTLRDRILYTSPSTGGPLNIDQAAGTSHAADNDGVPGGGDDTIINTVQLTTTSTATATDTGGKRRPSTTGCVSEKGKDNDYDSEGNTSDLSEKGGGDSGREGSKSSSQGEEEDMECGVCLEQKVEVAFSGCNHSLCIDCARNLTKQEKRPPSCPFCRKMIVGFYQP